MSSIPNHHGFKPSLPERLSKWGVLLPLVFLASLLTSTIIHVQDSLINPDAVTYLVAADCFGAQGFEASRKVFAWPFFQMLIYWVASIFNCSLELAARGIGSVFAATLCALWVLLYEECAENRSSRRHRLIAAFVILTLPVINDYRDEIIRDFGFWCFSIAGLLALIRFLKKPGWVLGVVWQSAMILAALFRPEAWALLAAAGGTLLLQRDGMKSRVVKIAQLYFLPVIGIAVFLAMNSPQEVLHMLNATEHFALHIDADHSSRLRQSSDFIERISEGRLESKEILPALAIGLIGVLILKLLVGLEVAGFSAFALILWTRTRLKLSLGNRVILFFCGVLFVILGQVALNIFIVSHRYNALLLILATILLLQALLVACKKLPRGGQWAAVGFLFLAISVDYIRAIDGPSKDKSFIREAAEWVSDNADANTRLISSSSAFLWYSGLQPACEKPYPLHEGRVHSELNASRRKGAPLVLGQLAEDGKAPRFIEQLIDSGQLTQLKEFTSPHGDSMVLYRKVDGPN